MNYKFFFSLLKKKKILEILNFSCSFLNLEFLGDEPCETLEETRVAEEKAEQPLLRDEPDVLSRPETKACQVYTLVKIKRLNPVLSLYISHL